MSITSPPKDFSRLFLDMNAFFASVEQQVQPPLRGRPIGITPYTGDTGCVIARSYEAKNYGVKTGDTVGDAKRKCPKIQIVEARPALYLLYHKEILKMLNRHSPFISPLSVDEFSIKLTGSDQSLQKSLLMAKNIKTDSNKQVGDYLKCSIGLGPSVWLSKVASEIIKPDGLTIVTLEKLADFYQRLDLLDLPGINFQMKKHFLTRGLKTPLDLFEFSLGQWQSFLGHMGRLWYFRLRGHEVDEHVIKNKTIGHSHVLAPEFRHYREATSVIKKLIQKTGRRLREQHLIAGGVYLAISFYNHQHFNESRKTADFSDDQTLTEHLFLILKQCRFTEKPLRVAVSVFNLKPALAHQRSLFPEIEKRLLRSLAVDRISDRFGSNIIYPASVMEAKDSAPDRIPFGLPRYEIRN